jgi:hypothetical protein
MDIEIKVNLLYFLNCLFKLKSNFFNYRLKIHIDIYTETVIRPISRLYLDHWTGYNRSRRQTFDSHRKGSPRELSSQIQHVLFTLNIELVMNIKT